MFSTINAIRQLGLAVAVMFCSGCLEEEATFDVAALAPAQVSLAGLHSIAVLPVPDSSAGTLLAAELEHVLRQGTNLVVADRGRVLTQVQAAPALADPSDTARLLGVDGVVYIELEGAEVQDDYAVTPLFDNQSTQYVRTLLVHVSARVHVIDAQGTRLGTSHVEVMRRDIPAGQCVLHDGPRYDRPYLERIFPAVDALAYVQSACAGMAGQFLQDTTPHFATTNVILFYDPDDSQSVRAVQLASRGDWRAAAAIYRQGLHRLDRIGSYDVRAMGRYNLGIALIHSGNPEEAELVLKDGQRLVYKRRVRALLAAAREQAAWARIAQEQARVTGFTWGGR